MQSLYETALGPVFDQGVPLIDGMAEVPSFDRAALIAALRADQAGQTTFREFAAAAWRAGVIRYVVDLENRTCTYFGLQNQAYLESYAPPTAQPINWAATVAPSSQHASKSAFSGLPETTT